MCVYVCVGMWACVCGHVYVCICVCMHVCVCSWVNELHSKTNVSISYQFSSQFPLIVSAVKMVQKIPGKAPVSDANAADILWPFCGWGEPT